jgi:hypothetical protein
MLTELINSAHRNGCAPLSGFRNEGAQTDMPDLIKTAVEFLDLDKNAMQNDEAITAKMDQWEGTSGSLVSNKRMYNQARQN